MIQNIGFLLEEILTEGSSWFLRNKFPEKKITDKFELKKNLNLKD